MSRCDTRDTPALQFEQICNPINCHLRLGAFWRKVWLMVIRKDSSLWRSVVARSGIIGTVNAFSLHWKCWPSLAGWVCHLYALKQYKCMEPVEIWGKTSIRLPRGMRWNFYTDTTWCNTASTNIRSSFIINEASRSTLCGHQENWL